MNEIEILEKQIRELESEKTQYVKNADDAYAKKDYNEEDKNQKEIDSRTKKIDELKTKIIEIKYKDFDIEQEIKKKKEQHNWQGGAERCHNCSMKRVTTFSWKANGVRVNWKEGFKSTAIEILENMECKRHG